MHSILFQYIIVLVISVKMFGSLLLVALLRTYSHVKIFALSLVTD